MDYKEKYQEALDLARTFHDGYIIQGHNGEAGILEEIFSELKESEDEKIRKEIIDFLELPHHQFVGKRNHEKWIAWLENQSKKQGKSALEVWKDMRLEVYQQASGNRHEPNYSDDSTKMFSLNDIDEIIENISEQSHDDKTKPQFKVGDWIVTPQNKVLQITNIEGTSYVFNNASHYWEIYYCDKQCRLWSIDNAKDGDVLVTTTIRNCPFIYRKTSYKNNLAYYYVGIDGNGDLTRSVLCHFGSTLDVTPATKEQRDLLFQKIKEAGYEWDAEKKKLNRLVDSFPVKPVNEK